MTRYSWLRTALLEERSSFQDEFTYMILFALTDETKNGNTSFPLGQAIQADCFPFVDYSPCARQEAEKLLEC